MKRLLFFAVLFMAIGMVGAENIGTDYHAHSDIPVVDSDWLTLTATNDCAPDYDGWCADRWFLTLSTAKDVTIAATDKFCIGDYFEIYVDDVLVTTTPVPGAWGCGQSGTLSSGSVTLSLLPGTYKITVRDAGFDGYSAEEIAAAAMCPAGFEVSGKLTDYTGPTPAPEPVTALLAVLLTCPAFAYLAYRKSH